MKICIDFAMYTVITDVCLETSRTLRKYVITDKVDDLSKKLKGYVFVKRVVNFDVLIKMTDEFSSRFGQLCIGLMDKVNEDPSHLESSVQCQLEAVNTHCKEVKNLKQLVSTRELQLNDWAVDTLKEELWFLHLSNFPTIYFQCVVILGLTLHF